MSLTFLLHLDESIGSARRAVFLVSPVVEATLAIGLVEGETYTAVVA